MVNRVAVLLFHIFAVHQVYSEILTNIKTEAGVLTLLQVRELFYGSDYDDDNMISFEDFLRDIVIDDVNNDGNVTYEEAKANPATSAFSYEIFQASDVNSDGVLNTEDAKQFFELLPGSGKNLDLQEFLTIYATRTNETKGPVMKIQAFIQAERDCLFMDETDDNILTRREFQVQFRIVDENKNGNLEESEVRNMFPMRSTPPEIICPNLAVGCSVDDVLPLFDAADKNEDSQISIDEYIQHFGHLIKN